MTADCLVPAHQPPALCQLHGEVQAAGDGVAVENGVVRVGLQGVAQGVPQVQAAPPAVLLQGVRLDCCDLALHRSCDDLHQELGCRRQDGVPLVRHQLEELTTKADPHLERLGQARAQLFRRQALRKVHVRQHQPR